MSSYVQACINYLRWMRFLKHLISLYINIHKRFCLRMTGRCHATSDWLMGVSCIYLVGIWLPLFTSNRPYKAFLAA